MLCTLVGITARVMARLMCILGLRIIWGTVALCTAHVRQHTTAPLAPLLGPNCMGQRDLIVSPGSVMNATSEAHI